MSVLAMVLVVLLILIVIAFTQAFSRSAGAGAVLHVTDVRSAFECGDAALAEAVVVLRDNLDSGKASPECPDDWRALIAQAFANPGTMPAGRKIVPRRTRATFQLPNLSSSVSDVTVELVDVVRPEAGPGGATPPLQGVLEMRVRVQVDRLTTSVRKTVRQRRSFYLSWPPGLPGTGDPGAPTAQFTLLANPLATVVE